MCEELYPQNSGNMHIVLHFNLMLSYYLSKFLIITAYHIMML